jgi:hypothetical protein
MPLYELFLLFCQIFNGILQLGTILYSAYWLASALLTGMQAFVVIFFFQKYRLNILKSGQKVTYLFSSWRQEIWKSNVCVFVWRIFLCSYNFLYFEVLVLAGGSLKKKRVFYAGIYTVFRNKERDWQVSKMCYCVRRRFFTPTYAFCC